MLDVDEGLDATGNQAAPELIRQFELFRAARTNTTEVFNEREGRALARLRGDERLGLVVSQTRSVPLTASVKVLAIPGERGAFLMISTAWPDGRPDLFGGGAHLRGCAQRRADPHLRRDDLRIGARRCDGTTSRWSRRVYHQRAGGEQCVRGRRPELEPTRPLWTPER